MKNISKIAYLFSGAAKNSLTNKSDIDFLFSFDEDLDYEIYAEIYYALLHDLEQLLHRNVDLIAEKTLSSKYLIESINSSKIYLL